MFFTIKDGKEATAEEDICFQSVVEALSGNDILKTFFFTLVSSIMH